MIRHFLTILFNMLNLCLKNHKVGFKLKKIMISALIFEQH